MSYRAALMIPVYNHPHYIADLVAYLSQFALPIVFW